MSNKITSTLSIDYLVKNSSVNHTWISDEPEGLGGKDTGPNPVDLFLSSLASCKLITMKMYANRKKFKVEKITIEITLLQNTENDIIQELIHIQGELSDDEKNRMIEISKKCPVSKMLQNPIEIITLN